MNVADEHVTTDVDDRVINHLFGCGLTLAGVLARPDVNDNVTHRLLDAIEELDHAVTAIRGAALTAHVATDCDPQPEMPAHAAAAVSAPEPRVEVPAPSDGARRRLCRFADDVFAYALYGHDFYRASDHELWAHESQGLLLSARSGTPFARREGNVFCDLETNVPLYYEDHTTAPPTLRTPERTSVVIAPQAQNPRITPDRP